jgi:4-hydroxy-tetrahydrodipicolinate synthase
MGNRGRVPFVAGVSHLTTRSCVALAEAAARAGADAVIAMAPFMKKASDEQVRRHFQAIAAVGLPVIVQNANWLTGAGVLAAPTLRMLTETIPQVQHVKEEAPVLPQTISRILAAAPGAFQHVFGGGGGRFLIDELNRGSAGTMLACEWADVFGSIFDLYERGELAEARRRHTTALAGVNLEAAYGMAGAREVLRRRGVIRSTAGRYASPVDELDAAALGEIEATLELLAPAFRYPSHRDTTVEEPPGHSAM